MHKPSKPSRSRPAYVAAGLAGAVALGTAAVTTADRSAGPSTVVRVPAVAEQALVVPQRAFVVPRQATAGPSLSPAATPSLTDAEKARVAAARAYAAKHTVPITHPLAPPTAPSAIGDLTVTSRQRGDRTLRIVSARGDLSGQRELSWVADKGRRQGSARCSQTIRLSPDVAPERRPTLLLCWRTSAKRSVYTVMVDLHGRPSVRQSVAAIDTAWAKLR
jgi:hypothetical protein